MADCPRHQGDRAARDASDREGDDGGNSTPTEQGFFLAATRENDENSGQVRLITRQSSEKESTSMPDCPDIFVWNNVPAGSSLRAQSSASDGNGSSNDYDVTVHIVLPSGATVDWVKTGLDPGPAGPLVLIAGPYGVSATLTCGPSGPTAKLRIWIEGTAFDCTWTNNAAGTSRNINGAIAVVAA